MQPCTAHSPLSGLALAPSFWACRQTAQQDTPAGMATAAVTSARVMPPPHDRPTWADKDWPSESSLGQVRRASPAPELSMASVKAVGAPASRLNFSLFPVLFPSPPPPQVQPWGL